eukprot:g5779.t1
MSNRIASLMAITALTGSNTVTFDDESTDYNDWVKAGEDAGALLDDDKVPHAGRYALVKPEFFRKVAQANYYGSSDFRQGADNTNLANTFTAAGVTWIAWPSPVFSQNLSSNTDYPSKYRRDFSADRLQGIVFSDSAFAVKMAEALSVEENYIPERRAHLITAAVQFGTAVLHSEGFAAIIGDAWRKFGHYVTLTPNSSGEIDVSAYMRVVYPLSVRSRLTERNGKVWDIKNNVAYATAIEQAFVLSDIDFAQISSATWAEYITLEAAVDMAQRTNDVDANYAVIAEQRNQARRQAYNESRVRVFDMTDGSEETVVTDSGDFAYLNSVTAKEDIRTAGLLDSLVILNRQETTVANASADYFVAGDVITYDKLFEEPDDAAGDDPTVAPPGAIFEVLEDWNEARAGFYQKAFTDGSVIWSLVAPPKDANAVPDATTLPHRLVHDEDNDRFVYEPCPWRSRLSGSDATNPAMPWFGEKLEAIAAHAGRLFLFGASRITSGEVAAPRRSVFNLYDYNVDVPAEADRIEFAITDSSLGEVKYAESVGNDLVLLCENGVDIFTSGLDPLTAFNGRDFKALEFPVEDVRPAVDGPHLFFLDKLQRVHWLLYEGRATSYQGAVNDHRQDILQGETVEDCYIVNQTVFFVSASGSVKTLERYVLPQGNFQLAWGSLSFHENAVFVGHYDSRTKLLTKGSGFSLLNYLHRQPFFETDFDYEICLDRRESVTGTYVFAEDRTYFELTGRDATLTGTTIVATKDKDGNTVNQPLTPVHVQNNRAYVSGKWTGYTHYAGFNYDSKVVFSKLWAGPSDVQPLLSQVNVLHRNATDYTVEITEEGESSEDSPWSSAEVNVASVGTVTADTGVSRHMALGDARYTKVAVKSSSAGYFEASRTATNVAALLGSVGAAAQHGIRHQQEQLDTENAKRAAMLKVRQLDLDEKQRFAKTEKQEEARELARTEQAARHSAQQFEKAITEIERTEKLGIFNVVNGLSEGQLRSANARGLGFTTPEAILAADQAIGERQANLDFPRLLNSITHDESKLPSEHLSKFLQGQALGSPDADSTYAATLADRLEVFEKNAVINRAKKARAIASQNAVDGFQFNIVNGFETLDPESFQGYLSALHRGLKRANPAITGEELKATAVEAMAPLFVGREARFSASEGLLKLSELFTAEDVEKFGLGGVVAQLNREVANEMANTRDNTYRLAKRQLEAAPGHEAVGVVMQSIMADTRLNGLQRAELQQIADNRFAEADYKTEVQQRYAGDRSVAMTPAHDRAIEAFLNEKGNDTNYTIENRLFDSATRFGRILQSDVDSINALADSGNDREAIARFATIRAANPNVAQGLEGKVGDKVFVLSRMASLGVVNAERYVAEFEGVSEENFSIAADVIKNEKTEAGKKLETLVKNSAVDLARSAAGASSKAVMDASISQTYEQLVRAGIARTIAAEGVLKPEELFARGNAFAKSVLGRHVGQVKLGDDKYVLPNDALHHLGFSSAGGQYLKQVSDLWSSKQNELEDAFGGDVLLNFGRAEVENRDGIDYAVVPIRVRDQLFGNAEGGVFEFPMNSATALKKLIAAEEARNKKPARQLNMIQLNIFSRGVWLATRDIHSAAAEGTQRVYDADAKAFTTQIDVDEWIGQNEQELQGSSEGQRVLRNYLAGYYDDIDDAGTFLTAIGYDMQTGRERELADNAGLTAKLGGNLTDPTLIVGGAAIRVGAGTAMKLKAGTTLGKAFTSTRLASRNALLGGRLGSVIGENVKIGMGATLVNEIGQRTVSDIALDRTMWDTAVDAATGIVADSTLSAAFFGFGRGIRAATNKAGVTKPLDFGEVRTRAEADAKTSVTKVEEEARSLFALIEEAEKFTVPSARLERTTDGAMNELDLLYVTRQQIQEEVNTLQASVTNAKSQQLPLFDEVDIDGTRLTEGGVADQEVLAIRLAQAKARLKEVDSKIAEESSVIAEAAAEGTVTVTRSETPTGVEEAAETGIFDRQIFRTKEEARAAGYAGAGTQKGGLLSDQVGAMGRNERANALAALADPTVIDSLRRVRDAISNAETVQAADMEGDLLNALRAIENRSPNLSWNPASLGVGTVQTVKIDQPILYAETVGFVPTTPAEDIILALKQLGAFDQLEGGVSGLAPVRNGKPRSKPPASIPPSLGARYAGMGQVQIGDLALDLSNDATQKAVKAARQQLADRLNKQGIAADADDFTGVGLAGMASQLGTGLAYSTSLNRVTSSLYNVFFESPFTSRLFTKLNSPVPENLRVPLEVITHGIAKRVAQNEESLVRAFKGFRNKRGKRQFAITPALMGKESRAELSRFYETVEHVRLLSYGQQLDDAQILSTIQRNFPDADASTVAIVRRASKRLRQELPTTGRGKLNGDELHAVRHNSTSVLLNTNVSLEQAVRVLRRAQELPEAIALDERTLRDTVKIFRGMTDGEISEITTADIKAALSNPNGPEADYLKQRLVSLWNRRLNGVMNRQTALGLIDDEALTGAVRLDAVQAQRAYQQQAVRLEMLEKLTDFNLVLQRMEQARGGQTATAETAFTELFHRYEQLVKDWQIARTAAESGQDVFGIITVTDKADRLLSESIDATTSYAVRQSDRIKRPGDTEVRAQRRFKVLEKEADNLNELLKSEAGFIFTGRSDKLLSKIGDAALGLGRSTMLSRMAISMTADPANAAAKSLAVGMAPHLPKSAMKGIVRSLQRIPEADRPELLRMLTAWEDNALHNLSLGTDLGFTDLNRTASQASVGAVDRVLGAIESPVSRASFFASGGRWLDSTLRQTGTIQALVELSSQKGLITRLSDALEMAGPDASLREVLDSVGQAGNYSSYAHVLRFLSPDDIRILSKAIADMRFDRAVVSGRVAGEAKIDFLQPVDRTATPEVQRQQQRAMVNFANLVDSWVEFRQMTVPHAVDRPRARADAQSFPMRIATQFMSAGLAASRTVALQTNNDGLIRRAFYVGTAVATAMGVRALRSIIKGDDERYLEEIETQPLLVLADAIGWSGVTGVLGDKLLPTVTTFFLGENAAYDSRRNLDFAITTPLQAYLERVFAATTRVRDFATGEEASDFEKRAFRSVISAGLLDSLASDAVLLGTNATGAEDLPPFEQTEGTLIIMRQSWVNGLLVDFAGGATLSEATLDLAAKQLYYLWEESIAIGLDAFETNDDDQKFNAIFNFDGDGVLDSFRLTNSSITIDDEPSKIAVWVFVNGAFVQSDDYTLSQDTDNVLVVNLDRVPATGEFVEVRVAQFEALTAAIADGEIDCDKLAAGAICALSKFDLDGAGSARQVMGWDASTNFGARSLTHDDIGDFDTAVEAKRLDQFADPTANINMGGNKLTNGAAGTADTDFIIKSQLPLGDNFEVNSSLHEIPLILNPAGRQFRAKGLDVPDYAKTRCLALYTPTDSQPNDFYQYSEESFFNRFKVHRFPAIISPEFDANGFVTSGQSAWPERWPFEVLKDEQNRNPFVFRIERQVDNSPVQDERSLIRFEKIPQSDAKAPNLVCFVDPSGGSDEYAYAIGAMLRNADGTSIHVQRVGGWRNLTPDEAGVELLDVLHNEGVQRLYVEENFPAAATTPKRASSVMVFDCAKFADLEWAQLDWLKANAKQTGSYYAALKDAGEVGVDGKDITIGNYRSKGEAMRARDKWAEGFSTPVNDTERSHTSRLVRAEAALEWIRANHRFKLPSRMKLYTHWLKQIDSLGLIKDDLTYTASGRSIKTQHVALVMAMVEQNILKGDGSTPKTFAVKGSRKMKRDGDISFTLDNKKFAKATSVLLSLGLLTVVRQPQRGLSTEYGHGQNYESMKL